MKAVRADEAICTDMKTSISGAWPSPMGPANRPGPEGWLGGGRHGKLQILWRWCSACRLAGRTWHIGPRLATASRPPYSADLVHTFRYVGLVFLVPAVASILPRSSRGPRLRRSSAACWRWPLIFSGGGGPRPAAGLALQRGRDGRLAVRGSGDRDVGSARPGATIVRVSSPRHDLRHARQGDHAEDAVYRCGTVARRRATSKAVGANSQDKAWYRPGLSLRRDNGVEVNRARHLGGSTRDPHTRL